MEALVTYYRMQEAEVPDFTAVVTLGSDDAHEAGVQGPLRRGDDKDVPMSRCWPAARRDRRRT